MLPYLARQRCRRGERAPMGQGPFLVRQGERRAHEEQIEAKHAGDFTQLRSSPER